MTALFKKKLKNVVSFAIIIFALFTLTSLSSINYKIATLFFGRVPKLYNVSVSQYFFKRASTPLIGKVAPYSYYQLSRTYFIQGNLGQAIVEADNELKLYPENCRTYYIRGLTYGYLENLDAAISDFETFNTTCVKNSWAGHNDLAWFYFRKGDMKKVIETVEKVIDRYPTNPWLQNTYGTALLNVGRYKEAKEAFSKARDTASFMTEESWGRAYPGNNPLIYSKGLAGMRLTIDTNIKLTEEALNKK